ncbi:hypothetical protein GJ496_004020 [Pomphorhynchus laevis]|nr:hypothetical protein GJ496_004020 [Pomphorhynchus laevis]
MLAALYEASRYKFKTALDTLDNRPTQNHDISWLIVHTLHKNIPISFLRLHNSFKWSSGKQLQSNNGIQNGFMSDDNKIAGNNISPYPNISNGMIRNIENRRELCVVQFRYLARRPDELTINPGDVVSVIEKRPDKWWKGKLGTQCGLFPSTYVEEIDV